MKIFFSSPNSADLSSLESIKIYIDRGLISVNQYLSYLTNWVDKKTIDVKNPDNIGLVIKHFVNKGHNLNLQKPTPLKTLAQLIKKTSDRTKLGHISLIVSTLIDNGAGLFSLKQEEKSSLILNFLNISPEFVKTLVSKRLVEPNFQILIGKEKISLNKYLRRIGKVEIADFIDKEIEERDFIKEKEVKILKQDLTLESAQPLAPDVEKTLRKKIVDGVTTKAKNANFITINKDGRDKKFLRKPKSSVESKYGSDLARILSNKKFTIKNEILEDIDATVTSAIKFDEAIAGGNFLSLFTALPSSSLGEYTLKSYARLCGVTHVLGEYDWNTRNFFVSKKTGRIVKIDNNFLVNGYFSYQNARVDYGLIGNLKPYDRFNIYGSYQSRNLLCKRFVKIGDVVFETKKAAKSNIHDIDLARAYINDCNNGIDDNLLKKIKKNFANPRKQYLKDEFIEFMSGVEDAISLARNSDFLTRYTEKYKQFDEINEKSFKIASTCRSIFEHNASYARIQFGKFREYFADLALESKDPSILRSLENFLDDKLNKSEESFLLDYVTKNYKKNPKFFASYVTILEQKTPSACLNNLIDLIKKEKNSPEVNEAKETRRQPAILRSLMRPRGNRVAPLNHVTEH